MFALNDMDKLDVIIGLLLILISFSVIKVLHNLIINRMSGNYQLKMINYSIDQGSYESALKRCEKQLKKTPKDADFLWSRGRILFKLKKFDEATSIFEELVLLEPLLKKDVNIYLESINYET